MKLGTHGIIEKWGSIFRAENQMDDDMRERLWHENGKGLEHYFLNEETDHSVHGYRGPMALAGMGQVFGPRRMV